jgi:methylisocitrate lyase
VICCSGFRPTTHTHVQDGDHQVLMASCADARLLLRPALTGKSLSLASCLLLVLISLQRVFPEALPSVAAFHTVATAVRAPVLANLTEFGQTPLLSLSALHAAGARIALYPLTAFRAMAAAAARTYATVRCEGTQASEVGNMQTRKELYDALEYGRYQVAVDAALARRGTLTAAL